MQRKDIIYIFIILLVLALGAILFMTYSNQVTVLENDPALVSVPVEPDGGIGDGAEPLDELLANAPIETIGTSVEGNNIDVYRFGSGETNILLVAGVHGGYSWNTTALAYELIEYFENTQSELPNNVRLHIIPALNPDGLVTTLGEYQNINLPNARSQSESSRVSGRFNENEVDLNRNFDCNWEPESEWRNRTVSGGSAAFSEPETLALRDYINRINPSSAIVWFASEGKVYPSACNGGPSDISIDLANTFASGADYIVEETFDAYSITGDLVNWMARESIPGISVLLTNFERTEFERNLAGVEAVLDTYVE